MREFKLLTCFFIIITIVVIGGCSNNATRDYGLEDFKTQMTEKGYTYEINDVSSDFLSTERKQMETGESTITIYVFDNSDEMEKEASYISADGFSYDNGDKGISVDWISAPHFYKKGTIIVQYIGISESIISDLESIMGEQFSGK